MNSLEIEEEYYYELIELIQTCEEQVLEYERDKSDSSRKEICRVLHSLKGNCGMLQLIELENFFHTMESIFLKYSSKIKANIDPYLDTIDLIKAYMHNASSQTMQEASDQILGLSSVYTHETNEVEKNSLSNETKPTTVDTQKENKTEVIEDKNIDSNTKENLIELNVFIIDDVPEFLAIFERTLKDKGHKVKSFLEVEELKNELMTGNIPDLIISDFNMGEVKGSNVISALNTILPLVPKAICSGYLNYDIVLELINIGIIGILEKPFDSYDLEIILRKAQRIKINNKYINSLKRFLKNHPAKFKELSEVEAHYVKGL